MVARLRRDRQPRQRAARLLDLRQREAEGSDNLMGICSPVIDELVEQSSSRADRDAAARRDPCARPGAAVEPVHRAALAFAEPSASPTGTASAARDTPIRAGLDFDTWWIDPKRAAATESGASARRLDGKLPAARMAAYLLRRLLLL